MDRTFKSKIGWWYHLIIWMVVSPDHLDPRNMYDIIIR